MPYSFRLPIPATPDLALWPSLIKDAIIISIIAFSINVSLATLFSRKHSYKIDPTQVDALQIDPFKLTFSLTTANICEYQQGIVRLRWLQHIWLFLFMLPLSRFTLQKQCAGSSQLKESSKFRNKSKI